MTTKNPSVYVGTYKKYSEGSLYGAWVDLTKFDDKFDFIDFCQKLHKDEKDPELMFQDYEYFPQEFYSECGISDDLWDWLEIEEDQQEIINAFIKCFGTDLKDTLDNYKDAYMGHYNTFRDFVEEFFNEINEIPEHLISYIDYESVERDFVHVYIEHDGHIFNRNY